MDMSIHHPWHDKLPMNEKKKENLAVNEKHHYSTVRPPPDAILLKMHFAN